MYAENVDEDKLAANAKAAEGIDDRHCRSTTIAGLGRRLWLLRATLRCLVRWTREPPPEDRSALRAARELRRRARRAAAIRQAWLGSRAQRMSGHTRVRWPTEGSRAEAGPSDVLASPYGEAALGALKPQDLLRRIVRVLEEAAQKPRAPLWQPGALGPPPCGQPGGAR